MTETILRDGEVAFTSNGDVIMNVNTLLELRKKMKAEEENEQSAEDAMENVCVLLARIFGPAILDKGKVERPGVVPPPSWNPINDTHPLAFQQYFFPTPLYDIFKNPTSMRAANESPWLYVDNFGNVFPTMGEADYRHQLPGGTCQKIVSGKQLVGYSYGYGTYFPEEAKALKDYRGDFSGMIPTEVDRKKFADRHLVYFVRVSKYDLVPTDNKIPEKLRTTRESRYTAWRKAQVEAENTLRKNLRDNYKKIISNTTGCCFKTQIDKIVGR